MPATSFSVKFALLLVFVSSFLVNGTFQAPIDCTDGSNPLFIKTKYSQMTVRAGEALFCPIMPGSDVQDCSTWMNYRMLQIAELSNPALNDFCFDDVYIPPAAAPYIHILKAIDRTNLTCQGEKFEGQILAPGVSGDVLTTIFSYPDMPGVFIQLNYTVPNASLDVNMGTSEFMEGRDLIYSYRPNQIKQSMRIFGWPWVGRPTIEKSYLALHFDVHMGSDIDYEARSERTLEGAYAEIETRKVKLVQSLDTAGLLDGIPRFKRFNPIFYGPTYEAAPGHNTSIVTSGITSCYPSMNGSIGAPALFLQFDEFYYDPQFSVIFGQIEDEKATPQQKKSKTGVIVGVSIASVLVAALIVGVILAMIYVPSFRDWVRPFSKKRSYGPSPESDKISLRDPSSEPSSNSNGWVRGTTTN